MQNNFNTQVFEVTPQLVEHQLKKAQFTSNFPKLGQHCPVSSTRVPERHEYVHQPTVARKRIKGNETFIRK